jgi:hypothetical protein
MLPRRLERRAQPTQERSRFPLAFGVYQITKNGLALQLTLQGTKYYKDDDLNQKS